ncbi:phage tail protein [Tateyamaria sp. syn59]|uniref:phage tail protein n=1 Tax=Tateyamaria sp. syn59 TaxID=2576942 RepID=UPI0011BDF4D0|nr:phage tail protein [Tateyamaria sp. syn59]
MIPSFLDDVPQPVVKGYSRKKRAGVRRAEFEGGYSQRSGTGPNAVIASVRLQWVQANAPIDAIDDFLEARAGKEVFYYRLPDDSVDRLWTCAEWDVNPKGPNAKELTATLQQEFDVV